MFRVLIIPSTVCHDMCNIALLDRSLCVNNLIEKLNKLKKLKKIK